VFDANEAAIIRRVAIAGVPLGLLPSADGKAIYVTLAASGKIARIDLDSFRVDADVDLGRVADGIGWAGPG
jgi:DNA-binding beta-propeller fold protein YncE